MKLSQNIQINTLRIFIFIFSLFIFSNINAELTVVDLIPGSGDELVIRDSENNKEWLKLTATQGLSVVNVIDNGVGGFIDYGFELASVDQVEGVFLEGGIVELNTGFIEENFIPASNLISLFGCTQGCDGDLPATQGWVQAPSLEDWVLHGVVQTAACCPPSGRAYVLDISASPKTTESEVMGIFLVRSSSVEVDIDIQPNKTNNKIRLDDSSLVPVAILSSAEFDGRLVDASSVRFGPFGAVPVERLTRLKDVNKDGFIDHYFRFVATETGIQCGDTEAILTGTYHGDEGEVPVFGSDSFTIRRCK